MRIDIHSHDSQPKPNQIKVFSLRLQPNMDAVGIMGSVSKGVLLSVGVHPWDASLWAVANSPSISTFLLSSQVALIGEIGLDKVCRVSLKDQLFVFEEQLKIAAVSRKSVLIHLVGHQSELLAYKRKFHDIPAWILHGFRGKALLAEQYIKHGFFLSFGMNYQPEALRACPLDRIFLETDESNIELYHLYEKAAMDLGLSVKELEASVSRNFEALGLK